MTKRAIVLGLLGTLLMGAYGQYASKYIPGSWGFVRGYMPVSAYGLLLVFALALNPLIGRLRAGWRLRGTEMALITSMILLGCAIADQGMMRYFPRQMVHPIHLERANPGWQKAGLLKMTPPAMLANDGGYSEEVVENYVGQMWDPGDEVTFEMTPVYATVKALVGGDRPERSVGWGEWLATGFGQTIPVSDVPWHAWVKPMTVWGLTILFVMMAVIGLATVVHRQWADRERIRYPLAELVSSVLQQDEAGRTTIARNRLFWVGLAVPFLIRVVNGIYMWTDGRSIEIPMSLDLSALSTAFPEFMRTPGASTFASPALFPACVGLTYLLASDIGFSLGIVGFISVVVLYFMMAAGVDLTGSAMMGGVGAGYGFGSSLAMILMLVWIGRRYYWQTLKSAVTFRVLPETEPAAVWGCRVFVVGSILSTVVLALTGMDPLVAAAAIGAVMLLFVTIARVNAECGLFFFGVGWVMPAAVVGLFGAHTLGPAVIICLGMMKYLVQGDGEHLMPFVTNGLKMTADTGLKAGRTALLFGGAILLTIAVAIPTALWADYSHAAELRRGGDGSEIFDAAESVAGQLSLSGDLDRVMSFGTLDRLINIRPDRRFIVAGITGFALFLAFSAFRLRFSWWPLHPVAVLLAMSGGVGRFMFSFLLGWSIKAAVTQFGGATRYTEVKPMMIGVIVGDLAGGFLFLVVSWAYYAVTGTAGKSMLLW